MYYVNYAFNTANVKVNFNNGIGQIVIGAFYCVIPSHRC